MIINHCYNNFNSTINILLINPKLLEILKLFKNVKKNYRFIDSKKYYINKNIDYYSKII